MTMAIQYIVNMKPEHLHKSLQEETLVVTSMVMRFQIISIPMMKMTVSLHNTKTLTPMVIETLMMQETPTLMVCPTTMILTTMEMGL